MREREESRENAKGHREATVGNQKTMTVDFFSLLRPLSPFRKSKSPGKSPLRPASYTQHCPATATSVQGTATQSASPLGSSSSYSVVVREENGYKEADHESTLAATMTSNRKLTSRPKDVSGSQGHQSGPRFSVVNRVLCRLPDMIRRNDSGRSGAGYKSSGPRSPALRTGAAVQAAVGSSDRSGAQHNVCLHQDAPIHGRLTDRDATQSLPTDKNGHNPVNVERIRTRESEGDHILRMRADSARQTRGHWLKLRKLNLTTLERQRFEDLREISDGPVLKSDILRVFHPVGIRRRGRRGGGHVDEDPRHRRLVLTSELKNGGEYWEKDPFTQEVWTVQWVPHRNSVSTLDDFVGPCESSSTASYATATKHRSFGDSSAGCDGPGVLAGRYHERGRRECLKPSLAATVTPELAEISTIRPVLNA